MKLKQTQRLEKKTKEHQQTQRPREEKKMKPLLPPLEPSSPGAFTTWVQCPSPSGFSALHRRGLIFVVSSSLFGFDLHGSWFLCVSKLCCWSWSWNGFVCFVLGLWVCLGLLISFFSRSVEVEVISFLSRLKLSFVSLWVEVEFLSLGNLSL